MDKPLKTRLVGAVVLVSLAVIFVPMLLDGASRGGSESPVPPKPEYQFETLEIPIQPASEPPTAPKVIDKPEKPAPVKPVARPAPKPAAREPAPAAQTISKKAWVVQVGSFSHSQNALALRDKLRKQGYTAFVERLDGSDGVSYRVRIGPELMRERAESLREKVAGKLGLKGIVMQHGS